MNLNTDSHYEHFQNWSKCYRSTAQTYNRVTMSDTMRTPATFSQVRCSGDGQGIVYRIPGSRIPVASRNISIKLASLSVKMTTGATKRPSKIPQLVFKPLERSSRAHRPIPIDRTPDSKTLVRNRCSPFKSVSEGEKQDNMRKGQQPKVFRFIPQDNTKKKRQSTISSSRKHQKTYYNSTHSHSVVRIPGSKIPIRNRDMPLKSVSPEKKQDSLKKRKESKIPRFLPDHKVKESINAAKRKAKITHSPYSSLIVRIAGSKIPLRNRESPLSSISEARNQAIKTARKLTKIPQWHGNGENRKSVRPIQALPTKNPVASELQTSENYLAERITQVVRKIRREMEEKRMREKELAQKRRIRILRRMFRM